MWNDEKIRFMRDAAEYGGFYGALAEQAAKHIGAEDSVCDAGCGLGYLSLALLPRCGSVTAADCSGEALSAVLKDRAQNESRLTLWQGDVFSMPGEMRFDEMIFCFFGSTEEVLRTAAAHCEKRAILFRKDWESRRFSLGRERVSFAPYGKVLEELADRGVPGLSDSFRLDMGQPFRTPADAVEFFRLYNSGEQTVTESDVIPQLGEIHDGGFTYYLPAERPVGMIVLEADDIRKALRRKS